MTRSDRPLPDHGLPNSAAPDHALIERVWRILSRWAVPVMMTLAYVFLAATSDTNIVGKAWMALGLGFVLVVWFVFRMLTETAALARALSVGDVARLVALADRHLSRKRSPADRAPFLVARGFAHQLCGEFDAALAALDEARPGPDLAPLAAAVRIGALVELGRPVEEARAVTVSAPGAPGAPGAQRAPGTSALGWLAEGQIAWRAGELDTATQRLARVIDDVRAGSATRAIAHVYAARVADARGQAAVATRHRAAAASLAPPDAIWLRG